MMSRPAYAIPGHSGPGFTKGRRYAILDGPYRYHPPGLDILAARVLVEGNQTRIVAAPKWRFVDEGGKPT